VKKETALATIYRDRLCCTFKNGMNDKGGMTYSKKDVADSSKVADSSNDKAKRKAEPGTADIRNWTFKKKKVEEERGKEEKGKEEKGDEEKGDEEKGDEGSFLRGLSSDGLR
jgi:hypothetical protein